MASSSWNTPKDVIFPKMMKIVIPGAPLREISYIKNILKSTDDEQTEKSAWFDFNMIFQNVYDKTKSGIHMFDGNTKQYN